MATFTKTVSNSVLGTSADDLILVADPAAALSGEIHGAEGNDELRFVSVAGQTLVVGQNVRSIDRVTIGTGSGAQPDASGTSPENIDASTYSGWYSDFQRSVPLELFGNAGDNVLTGTPFGRGDTSRGGGWPVYGDNLYGGPGDDTLHGLGGGDFLDGGEGDDLIEGGEGNDWLFGRAGDDTLDGGAGADWLYGGLGANRLIGGTGNDTYWLDASNLAASLEEAADGGVDHLVYLGPLVGALTLPANVELLTVQGPTSVTANDLANQLYADDAAQTLAALGGNDIVSAGGGDDTLEGGEGDDWLYGGAGGDTLRGGAGNDVLVPGAGTNALAGGLGDDVYWLEGGTDTVSEAPGEGTDQLVATGNAVLPANVETLCLVGGAAATLTGNAAANSLWGNAAANVIAGLDGDDLLVGAGGADTLEGGAGADWLYGQFGDDVLDGGAGADTMVGGTGKDRYIVDDVGDRVIEETQETILAPPSIQRVSTAADGTQTNGQNFGGYSSPSADGRYVPLRISVNVIA